MYDAVAAVGAGGFDLVFTGIGALCWLPDIARWAEVVAGLLRPGGRLFLREGHPVLWALDDERTDGVLALRYPYFEMPEPNAWDKYQDFGHSHFRNSLIWGEGLENVSIIGSGRIWGKGLVRSQPRSPFLPRSR